jgi:16S rRNA (guanine(966)-N(2))-methyltransferase RsmD
MTSFIRIIAGDLRGRKLPCNVTEDLRPTPQMVREAFFSIMGNAIPDRLFIDIFAGTGVIGMEALSRGASAAYFIERDFRYAQAIDKHLHAFELNKRAKLFRTDAYRWIAAWIPPRDPVNIFLSPPFSDLTEKESDLVAAVQTLKQKVPEDSVIVLQGEIESPLETIEEFRSWELRKYGRNILLIWQREVAGVVPQAPP